MILETVQVGLRQQRIFTHLPEHMSFSGVWASEKSQSSGGTIEVLVHRILVQFKHST